MATECYGRADDGIVWRVYHQLWSGPWWWELVLPDGQRIASPERYETEKQALDAVEDARRQALAGLPPVETMSGLRARAEAAETRAAQAEAEVEAWRELLLSRVRERCGDQDLHTDHPGAERDPEHRLWRVVSHRGVAGVGHTEAEALLRAFDAVRPDVFARAEAAEARAALAEADLDALARTVGAAIVAGSLAPGGSLTSPPQHAIVSTVNRLRARAEKAEAQAGASAEAMLRDLCAYLNEMVAIDPMMMYRLVNSRTICDHATFYRLTERRVSITDVGCLIGMLGLLNGWLSSRTRLTIMAHFDHDRGTVERFEVGDYTPEETDGEEPTAGST